MQLVYILAGLGLAYLLSKKGSENFSNITDITSNSSINFNYLNSLDFNTRNRIKNISERFPFTYFKPYDYNIPIALIYSVLNNESGSFIDKGTPNNLIVGDKGFSIGFMQVYKKGAIDEFARRKNKTVEYVFNLSYDEYMNFEIGLFYLDLCYKKSLEQNPDKVIYMSLKRYNGGLNVKETTQNSSVKYAENGMKFYNHLIKVFN